MVLWMRHQLILMSKLFEFCSCISMAMASHFMQVYLLHDSFQAHASICFGLSDNLCGKYVLAVMFPKITDSNDYW
jgi:hypothetical protein